MVRSKMRRRWIVLASICVLLAGIAAIAKAAIPDGGVIHGCYDRSGGLRVIDTAISSCRPAETPLDWGQTGEQGPPGPAGTDGTDGTDGVSGWELVGRAFNVPHGGTPQYVPVLCPSGKKVFGGGVTADDFRDPFTVMMSGPYAAGTGWVTEVKQTDSEDVTARVWAICGFAS
jgi:hypothetical protein